MPVQVPFQTIHSSPADLIILNLLKVSYMILARVSPVTHSVGNCVKRVVVIVTSVLFFRTPVSPINSLGLHLFISPLLTKSIILFRSPSWIWNIKFVQVPGSLLLEFSYTRNWRDLSPSPRLLDHRHLQVHPIELWKLCYAIGVISECRS